MIDTIEKYVFYLNSIMPKYSNITFDFRDFDNNGKVVNGFIRAKYGFSIYLLSINVNNYEKLQFDCRVESDNGKNSYCEFEYNHCQDFEKTVKTGLKWIEDTIKGKQNG